METTTTVHMNRGYIAELHNQRDPDFIRHENAKNEHIDIDNEYFDDSFSEVWKRSNLYDVYEQEFGKSLEDYNAKQKRADRKMSMDDYIHSIENDSRGKKQTKIVNGNRIVDEKATNQGKRTQYEITVAVGNTRADEYGERSQSLPRDLQYDILKEYYENFANRNPNFAVVNCDCHGDEFFFDSVSREPVQSAIGLHICFVPIGHNFKQGLSVQNSMNKALKEMGFSGYFDWLSHEKECLEEITHKKYAEYCNENPDFYDDYGDLDIIHPVRDSARKGGLDKEDYARLQDAENVINESLRLARVFDNGIEQNKNRTKQLDEREDDLKSREEQLRESQDRLAREQVALYQRENKLEKREKELSINESAVSAREAECERREMQYKRRTTEYKNKIDNEYKNRRKLDREKDKKLINELFSALSEEQQKIIRVNKKAIKPALEKRGFESDFIDDFYDTISLDDVEKKF